MVEKDSSINGESLKSNNGGKYESLNLENIPTNGICMKKTIPRASQRTGIIKCMNKLWMKDLNAFIYMEDCPRPLSECHEHYNYQSIMLWTIELHEQV